ncbi:MAG: DUF169 domain-containing protein [Bryobacteraceae bacterium]
MTSYRNLETQLLAGTGLTRRPIAIAFLDRIPEGVEQFSGAEPSSCSFWRLAAAGRTFYTVPGDHYNCPIGSYTQNTPLPESRAHELTDVLSLMGGLGYVRMEEVPGIFRIEKPPVAILYGPLGDCPVEPSVVLFAGPPARVMLLIEAAQRAGSLANLPLLSRPTCMALPAAMANGVVASAGCIGNREYTGVGEDELYVAVPASALAGLAGAIEGIAAANTALAAYHQSRIVQIRT